MAFWLASQREGQARDWIQRFDPRFWTVNFPRPMCAVVVSTAPDALRVDAVFMNQADLAGLIWASEDTIDHPLLRYATKRDYSRCTLSFHWKSSGLIPLDAVNGPTLTIEGRDNTGAARSWYVRLWNYAQGTNTDAQITLPFSALAGGYLLPAEADPVWPGDVDRMFISLVPPGYNPSSTAALTTSLEAWAELTAIACDGNSAVIPIGDVIVPPHGLAIATDFDDSGVQTPARLLRGIRQLGYRGSIVHYVGMSHFFRLTASGGGFIAGSGASVLNTPSQAWHAGFFAECARRGFSPIVSFSYELLAQYCPSDWQQRAFNGDPALTGYMPPSVLLSPASTPAMAWLQTAAREFVALMVAAAVPVRVQVGEPWWWVATDGRPCLYDAAARAVLGGAPVEIQSMRQPLTSAQTALLDAAGALLASSTAALVGAVRTAAAPAGAETLLLVFTPTVLDPATPEARRANLPIGWTSPAFDRLQLEDYDWLTGGDNAPRRAAYTVINQRLGYPPAQQDYFAGFATDPATSQPAWQRIDAGIDEAAYRTPHETFVWALPQICRDGYVRLPPPSESDDMQAFDDISYPLALGMDASIAPEFSTSISVTASGFERRNSLWTDARLRFDVGPGIRSDQELGTLIAFFRARRGAARGFLLRDPSDNTSNGMTDPPSGLDQLLGIGDGIQTDFPLIKAYGDSAASQTRRITRPLAASILVSVAGTALTSGWSLGTAGVLSLATPPASGAEVRAGFVFDVPVRFADDKLDIAGAAFAAGEAPSVPVVEIREAS